MTVSELIAILNTVADKTTAVVAIVHKGQTTTNILKIEEKSSTALYGTTTATPVVTITAD